MATFNQPDKTKKIVIFSLILLATAAIEFLLIVSLWKNDMPSLSSTNRYSTPPIGLSLNYDMLLQTNEILSERLKTLQQSDQQYADFLTESNNKDMLDSISRRIYIQEEIFRGTIDSIFSNSNNPADSGQNRLFGNIIACYKGILKSRHATGSLRSAINMNKQSFTPDAIATLKLTKELEEKNEQIASLVSKLRNPVLSTPVSNNRSTDDSEEIDSGKENDRVIENKLATLTAAYYSLKQDNERLLKQQSEISKANVAGDQVLKNTTIILQQKVNELNTALSLARVDCNITRADAAQIISNARQRKQLLSEASGILNRLATTDNDDIKRKVREKILRLNQVAAYSRD